MLGKKSMAEKTIVALIILIFSFLLILGVIKVIVSKADDVSGELICRGSVAAREKFSVGIDEKVTFAPLLCQTKDKELPISSKGADKETVENDMAELVKRCWWQFGNGLVPNLFEDWFFGNNKCFVCYRFKIDDINAAGDGISGTEFQQYLSQTYITAKQYDKDTKDIKDVDQYTYTTYVQRSGGPGKIAVYPASFTPNEQYSIAIVSPKFFSNWLIYKQAVNLLIDEKADFNYILIEESGKIQDKCEIVADVSTGGI